MSKLNLRRIGGLIKMNISESPFFSPGTFYVYMHNVKIAALPDNKFNISVGGKVNGVDAFDFNDLGFADILFSGQAATDLTDFELKLSVLFPNAISSSGGANSSSLEIANTLEDISTDTHDRFILVLQDEYFKFEPTLRLHYGPVIPKDENGLVKPPNVHIDFCNLENMPKQIIPVPDPEPEPEP